jgi:tRNA (cmo5U34)-methyltransferase
MSQKDTLFKQQINKPGDFAFDERVVRVFPDMIDRSVPGYGLIIAMISLLARRHAQAGSNIYDLGCSLGAASLAMRQTVCAEAVKIIAVDNSAHMVSRFRQILLEQEAGIVTEVMEGDIRETKIRNASVVVLNFTLQFVDPADRLPLLEGIAAGLRPGGILILSEKLAFMDPAEQQRQTDWHHDFKRSRGYSELEIAQKRDALERVLRPETAEVHHERLCQAGFGEVYNWFQGFSFASFVALK